MGNKRSNCIKRKKAGVFFSLKLYRNLSLPRKINMICSSSLSIYCFYVYRVKGDRCSISFIKYLWTLFSSYCFKYELLFVWVRGHMRPTAYSSIDQRYLSKYQRDMYNRHGVLFLNCTCKFSPEVSCFLTLKL